MLNNYSNLKQTMTFPISKMSLLISALFFCVFGQAQICEIYFEDFEGQEGFGLTGPSPPPSYTAPAGWMVSGGTLTATSDYFKVVNGQMEARDVDTEVCWSSPEFLNDGMLCYEYFRYSFDASEQGTMEADDYLRSRAVVNGLAIPGANFADDFTSASYTSADLSLGCTDAFFGKIAIHNGADSEYHRFDNFQIEVCKAPPTLVSAIATCSGAGGTITVTATLPTCSNGALEYSLDGGGWQSSNVFAPLTNDTYTVEVRNSELTTCCTESIDVVVSCAVACALNVTCPAATDLGSFDCTTLSDIPDCPTDEASAEAAPYNLVIDDNFCGAIVVTCTDSPFIDACTATDQIITRTITIIDDEDGSGTQNGTEASFTCGFTFTMNPPTAPIVECPMDLTVANCLDQPAIDAAFTTWLATAAIGTLLDCSMAPEPEVYLASSDGTGDNTCGVGGEYIEICVTDECVGCETGAAIDLSGWEIEDSATNDGSPATSGIISSGSLLPGECVIIYSGYFDGSLAGPAMGTMGSSLDITSDRMSCPVWNGGGDVIYLYDGDSQGGATLVDSESSSGGLSTYVVPTLSCPSGSGGLAGCNPVLTDNSTSAPMECVGGTATVTFTVTDDCTSASCMADFVVPAAPAIVVTCPSAVNLASCTSSADISTAYTAWLGGFSFTGGCNAAVTSMPPTLPAFVCGAAVSLSYTYVVAGDCDTQMCASTFDVAASTALSVSCPVAVELAACSEEGDILAAYNTWLLGFSFSNGCNAEVTSTAPTLPAFACGAAVNLSYTYEVEGDCNTELCTSTFAVVAGIATDITCPTAVELAACTEEADILAAYNTWLLGFTTSGGCNSTVTSTPPTLPAFVCGSAVNLSYTYVVEGDCGIEMCTSTFAVLAATAPIVDCPENITIANFLNQAAIDSAFAIWLATAAIGSDIDCSTAPAPIVYIASSEGTGDGSCTLAGEYIEICVTDECVGCETGAAIDLSGWEIEDSATNDGSPATSGIISSGSLLPGECVIIYSGYFDGSLAGPAIGTMGSSLDITSDRMSCPVWNGGGDVIYLYDGDSQGGATLVDSESSSGGLSTYVVPTLSCPSGSGGLAGCNPVLTDNSTSAPMECVGGTASVTFTVADDCTSTSCMADFVVPAAPAIVVTCPSAVNLASCTSSADISTAYIAWLGGFSFIGGCNAAVTSMPPTLPAFVCGAAVSLSYTYVVAGDCDTQMCASTFDVAASTALSVSCPVAVELAACSEEGDILAAYNTWLLGFSFSNGCNAEVTSTAPTLPAFACGAAVNLSYTYEVEGDCNTELCTSTFAVVAGIATDITCPTAVELAACSEEADILAAYNTWLLGFTTSGGCNSTVTSTPPTLPAFVCGAAVNLSYTYVVEGDCGTEMCTSTFAVLEATAPIVECPENITIANCLNQAAIDSAFAIWLATAAIGSDIDCSTAPAPIVYIASSEGTGDGSCTLAGEYIEICVTDECVGCETGAAIDLSGWEIEDSATNDGSPATSGIISSGSLLPGECVIIYSGYFDGSLAGPAMGTMGSSLAITSDRMACPVWNGGGDVIYLYDGDSQGGATLVDSESSTGGLSTYTAPTISCPSGSGGLAGCNPVLSNNSTTAPLACVGGTATVTFTVTDDCTSTSCMANFVVPAAPAIVVTCPSAVNLASCTSSADISTAYTAWLGGFSFTGGCNAAVTSTAPALPAFVCGATVSLSYNYEVAGDCGSEMCISTFAVAAATALSVSCPAGVNLPACSTEAEITAAYTTWLTGFTNTGGCNPMVTSTPPTLPAFSCGSAVSLSYTYIVTGDCSTEMCSSTFDVAGTAMAMVICPSAVMLPSCSTDAEILTAYNVWLTGFVASGGCNSVVISTPPALPAFACAGAVNLSYTFMTMGDCGAASCTSTFAVLAATAPIVDCPENVTIANCLNQAAIDAAFATWIAIAAIGSDIDCSTAPAPIVYITSSEGTGDGSCTIAGEYIEICVTDECVGCETGAAIDLSGWEIEDSATNDGSPATSGIISSGSLLPGECVIIYSGYFDGSLVGPAMGTMGSSLDITSDRMSCPVWNGGGDVIYLYDGDSQGGATLVDSESSTGGLSTYTAPTISCPSGSSGLAGCNLVLSNNSTTAPLACVGGTAAVIFTVTDDCTSTSCMANFVVPAAPAIMVTCPSAVSLGSCTSSADISTAYTTWLAGYSFTGGCNAAVTSTPPALPTFVCGAAVSLSYTYEVAGDCGSEMCTSTFAVAAATALSVSCPNAVNLPACSTEAEITAAYTTWLAGFTNAAGCNPMVTSTPPTMPAFACGSARSLSYTYIVTGDCSTEMCSSTFDVAGTAMAMVICPSAVMLPSCSTDAEILTAYNVWLTGFVASGGCNSVVISTPPALPAFACAGAVNLSYTFMTMGDCGAASCTSTFAVLAATAPIVECPENITIANCLNQAAIDAAFATWIAIAAIGSDIDCNTAPAPIVYIASSEGTGDGSCTIAGEYIKICVTDECAGCETATPIDLSGWEIEDSATNDGSPATSGIISSGSLLPGECVIIYSGYFDGSLAGPAMGTMGSSLAITSDRMACPVWNGGGDVIYLYDGDSQGGATLVDSESSTGGLSTYTAPTISCPSGSGGLAGCNPVLSNNSTTAPLACVGGTATVTFTVTDDCTSTSCMANFVVPAAPAIMVTCPSAVSLGSCTSSADISTAYTTWLAGFSFTGGCNAAVKSTPPALPTFVCGTAVSLSYNYEVAGDCGSEMCTSTFAVAAATALSVSCPAGVNLPACSTEAEITAAYTTWLTGFTNTGGCNPMVTSTPPTLPAFSCGSAVSLSYTYIVTGDCSTEMCSSTFDVAGTAMAMVICPSAVMLPACSTDAEITAAYNTWLLGFVASGGCNSAVISISPALPAFVCAGAVNLSYTFMTMGDCGAASCTSTFAVLEATAPIVECPENITIANCLNQAAIDAAFAIWIATAAIGTTSDCSTAPAPIVYIASSEGTGDGSCTIAGEYIEICVTDECVGCETGAAIDLSGWEIEDSVTNDGSPATSGIISSGSLLPGECVIIYSGYFDGSLAGPAMGTMGSSLDITSDRMSCPVWNGGGDVIYLYDGDSQGGATLVDSESSTGGLSTYAVPTLSCPTGGGVLAGCNPILSNNSMTAPLACVGGTATVTFTVTDDCTSTSCEANFTVPIAPAPSVICPQDFTTEDCLTQTEINAAFASWLATASIGGTGCNEILTNDSTLPPSSCNGGTATVIFTVTDDCSSVTCSANFTVPAAEEPVVECPDELTVSTCLSQAEIDAAFLAWLASSAIGVESDCSMVDSPQVYLASSDGSGDGSCTTAGEFIEICLTQECLGCETGAAIDLSGWEIEDSASNDGSPATSGIVSSGSLLPGECVFIYSGYFDGSIIGPATGSMGSMLVITSDRMSCPVWNSGGDMIYLYDGDSQAGASLIDSESTSGGVSVYSEPTISCAAGSTFIGCNPVLTNNAGAAPMTCVGGSVTVVFTVTDDCTSVSCEATFTVPAAPAPSVVCPTDMTTSNCLTQDQIDAAYSSWLSTASPGGTGCNEILTNNAGAAPLACDGGSVTVTFTVTDDCTSVFCEALFTVPVPIPPTVECPETMTTMACLSQSEIDLAYDSWLAMASLGGGEIDCLAAPDPLVYIASSFEGSGIDCTDGPDGEYIEICATPPCPTCESPGIDLSGWVIEDSFTNGTTNHSIVIVNGTILPEECLIIYSGMLTVPPSVSPMAIGSLGSLFVIGSVREQCTIWNNSGDDIAMYDAAGGNLIDFESWTANGVISYDVPTLMGCPSPGGGCDAVLTYNSTSAPMACDGGISTVTFTASDMCNSVSCTSSFIVLQDVPPVVFCPSDKTIELESGQCGQFSTQQLPVFTDDCGAELKTISAPTNDDFISIDCDSRESDPILFSYSIEDMCGNVAPCAYTVTYIEYQSALPYLICNDHVNVSVDGDCSIDFNADMLLEGGPYGCYDCFEVSAVEIHTESALAEFEVTITDPISGASCWGTVTVEDKNDPTVDCADCTDPLVTDPDCIFNCTEEKLFTTFVPEEGRFGFDNNLLDRLIPSDGEDFIDDYVSDNCDDAPMTAGYVDSFSPIGNCSEGTLMTRTWVVNYDKVGGGVGTETCVKYYKFLPLEVFDADGNFIAMEAPHDTVTFTLPDVNGNDYDLDFYIPEEVEDAILMPKQIVVIPDCGVGTDPASIAAYYDDPTTLDRDTDDDGTDPDEFDVDCVIESNEGIWFAYPHYYIDGIRPTGPHAQPISEACNIITQYSDTPLDACAEGCNGNSKILRTWTILDWCASLHAEYEQIIKVVDDLGPGIELRPITVSVDPWDCKADVHVPAPYGISDNCDADVTYSIGYVEGAYSVTGDAENGYIIHDVPEGTIRIQYVAEDCCGNKGDAYTTVTVADETAPVPVTKKNIVIELARLGGNPDVQGDDQGTAKIHTADIDNGSYDSCTDVDMHIRRPMDDYCIEADTEWGDFVTFCCADLENVESREIKVEIRVCDWNGNCNYLDATVLLEDKAGGAIRCPLDLVLPCTADIWDFNLTGLPQSWSTCREIDLVIDTAEIYDDTAPRRKTATQGGPSLGQYFGTVVPEYNASCGFGAIRRQIEGCPDQWIIMEPAAPGMVTQNEGEEWIATSGFDASSISWPGDQTVDCDGYEAGAPSYTSAICNLTGPTVRTEEVNIEAGACKKILNHWTIIDWCAYDPSEPEVGGKYEHTQVIKIIDTEAPTVVSEDGLCFGVDTDECTKKGIILSATGMDNGICSSAWLSWTINVDIDNDWVVDCTYSSDASPTINGEPNPKYLPKSASGDAVEIVISEEIAASKGNHRVEWNVNDGCGNDVTMTTYFEVEDKKAPTPYCLNLGTAVMAPTTEFPNGMVELWAIDFNQNSFDNCSGDETLLYTFTDVLPPPRCDEEYSSNRDLEWYNTEMWFYNSEVIEDDQEDNDCEVVGFGEYDDGGYDQATGLFPDYRDEIHRWMPGLRSSGAVFTSDMLDASGFMQLPIYVWDECGSKDFCLVNLRIINNGGGAMVAGVVKTEMEETVENVQTEIMNSNSGEIRYAMTTEAGAYAFDETALRNDYQVSATKNDDYLNGVSTIDLVYIQRHILGLELLDSPYKMIAADINNDRNIDGRDLIELRKLILGIYTELPQNDSWKIIDAMHAEENLSLANPWDYLESISIADMTDDMMGQDFIGAKIGDLDNSALTSGLQSGGATGRVTNLEYEDGLVAVGEEVTITLNTIEELYGYQLTMDLSQMEYVNLEGADVNEGNVANLGDVMTMSYDNVRGTTGELFTLTLRAKTAGQISDLIGMNSEVTKAEAYLGAELEVVQLTMTDKDAAVFSLGQNEPNPFNDMTTIGFSLPEASEVTVTMYDVTGKVLEVIETSGDKGANTVIVKKERLTAGVVYYKLEAGEYTATKHMIVIE